MEPADHLKAADPLFATARPHSAQAMQTQAQILKSALELFNKNGVRPITTHAIAEKAGISPGNLYYHYKNKEEIIRAIFWRIDLFSQFKWAAHGPLNPKEGLVDFMRFVFGELSTYKFFFREFSALLQNDPILAKLWDIRFEHLYTAMRVTLHWWVKAGILKPFRSAADEDAFIDNFWVLANFSGVHLENRRAQSSHQSSHLLLSYLYPYHTEKGQRVLDLYLVRN